jgi:ribulose 1,5-bisphosphate carboxylase large subunit-like protein
MSSGNLQRSAHPELFRWNDGLDPDRYVAARYVVTSSHDGEATATAMAMEQSAATTAIRGYVEPGMIAEWTIRVLAFERLADRSASEVPLYHLATEVYADERDADGSWSVTLAIPRVLLAGKPGQLLNVAVGELPRLGFLSRFRLEELALPATFGPGPAFGVAGIRARFARPSGPLLCRSMRPAVGLDDATMARLNHDVLVGGFHLVKDDELQVFADNQVFRAHVEAMIAARDAARDRSGEHKGYLANLICEPDELQERWDIACALGVDGVLVAPAIQGVGTLASLARQARMPLLAHNTFSDLWFRHPGWGIAHSVLAGWMERFGADWSVTVGDFGAGDAVGPAHAGGAARRTMPIIQGGKHPAGLADYRRAVGGDDYMMIVASWVDSHPDGLEQAARMFRAAIDAQADA